MNLYQKSAAILAVLVLFSIISTNALANECSDPGYYYNEGIECAKDGANYFCDLPVALEDRRIDEECIPALESGCKDNFLDYVEELCPIKIEDFSYMKKWMLVKEYCEF
ncbi:MAG: hypothetical protein GY874_10885 [Desulfobacteraceae bacterium]|nr:hypothetical protein [Desulfobacteraceae bacterium]